MSSLREDRLTDGLTRAITMDPIQYTQSPKIEKTNARSLEIFKGGQTDRPTDGQRWLLRTPQLNPASKKWFKYKSFFIFWPIPINADGQPSKLNKFHSEKAIVQRQKVFSYEKNMQKEHWTPLSPPHLFFPNSSSVTFLNPNLMRNYKISNGRSQRYLKTNHRWTDWQG